MYLTDGRWTRALEQLPIVPPHLWWPTDERLDVEIDIRIQQLSNSVSWSPLCSSRSLTHCTRNQPDTLHTKCICFFFVLETIMSDRTDYLAKITIYMLKKKFRKRHVESRLQIPLEK